MGKIMRLIPANVMIAVGLGQSMGLSPAESLYRISVIKGKPSASAELIASNVRRAGHRLRVRGDETTCTATIIRADDPDYEFSVTRDLAWAQRMGLANENNYKRQPGTMLQWRAITAVARLACPEALYGVAYTPDEITDEQDKIPQQSRPTGLAAVRAAVHQTDAGASEPPEPTAPLDGPVEASDDRGVVHAPASPDEASDAITDAQRRALFAAFTSKPAFSRSRTYSVFLLRAALCSSVPPSGSFLLIFPESISILDISPYPFWTETNSGLSPLMSAVFTSAPAASSSLTHSVCPFRTAR